MVQLPEVSKLLVAMSPVPCACDWHHEVSRCKIVKAAIHIHLADKGESARWALRHYACTTAMIPEACPLSCQHARNIHRFTNLASEPHYQSARNSGTLRRSTCKATSHVLGSAEHPLLPAWQRKHGSGRRGTAHIHQQHFDAKHKQNAKPCQVLYAHVCCAGQMFGSAIIQGAFVAMVVVVQRSH